MLPACAQTQPCPVLSCERCTCTCIMRSTCTAWAHSCTWFVPLVCPLHCTVHARSALHWVRACGRAWVIARSRQGAYVVLNLRLGLMLCLSAPLPHPLNAQVLGRPPAVRAQLRQVGRPPGPLNRPPLQLTLCMLMRSSLPTWVLSAWPPLLRHRSSWVAGLGTLLGFLWRGILVCVGGCMCATVAVVPSFFML